MQRFKLALYAGLICAGTAHAAIPEQQAARLGKDLTPLGAEKAGNASGTIPAWTGGITTPPAGYKPGSHHLDPYASDRILFTITAENMQQYAEQLSAGHKAMFAAYPDWQMQIYPSRRSAAFPQRIYDATRNNATRAELANNGIGIKNSSVGIPFPIPKTGVEVVWNHLVRYRGDKGQRVRGQATPMPDGSYNLLKFNDKFDAVYSYDPEQAEKRQVLYKLKQEITSPAAVAGTLVLVHETTNALDAPRRTWTYSPQQKRVRRVGDYAYDDIATGSDGLATVDNFDMYAGTPDRYDWTIVGKKEIYIPYNAYRLHSDTLKYDDIIRPGHINPQHARYELHRVWVIDGKLKLTATHSYPRRTFYVDEDSWQIAIADHYDDTGAIWRVGEAHILNYYEVPVQWSTLDALYDLKAKRYQLVGLDNQESMYDFKPEFSASEFTPASVRRQGN